MRNWWGIRGHDREVSRSMVALAVFGALALALGLFSWVPGAIATDVGVASVEPGRLIVAPEATGIVTLGDGYTAALSEAGFRYAKDDEAMAETVRRGAPVVGLIGHVDVVGQVGRVAEAPAGATPAGPGTTTAHQTNAATSVNGAAEHGQPATTTPGEGMGAGRERIDGTLARVHITDLRITPGTATWTGQVSGTVGGRARALPLTWAVRLVEDAVVTTVTVEGADGLVLPLAWQPAVTGIAPVLPPRNLRMRAWWLAPRTADQPAFRWFLGTSVGIGPDVPRAVDLRANGHIDLHVWSSTATVTITGLPADRAKLAP